MHGAKSIKAADISKSGINEAKQRTKNFKNITYKNCSILDLPFNDEKFDLVWSAGVIHHTTDFDKSLNELTRVLKKGGKLFLLIYGSGGLRWKVIKSLRPIVKDLGKRFIEKAIDECGLPQNNKKHFMDDLFVPIQKLTKYEEIFRKLKNLKFHKIIRWEGNTFDHESDFNSQIEDIQKLENIANAAVKISKNVEEKYLSKISLDIIKIYLSYSKK